MSLTDYTDTALQQLQGEVYLELNRRATLANAPAQAEALTATYAAAIGRKDGDPWTQPTGAHDAYAKGITVTHGGKTWESLTPRQRLDTRRLGLARGRHRGVSRMGAAHRRP